MATSGTIPTVLQAVSTGIQGPKGDTGSQGPKGDTGSQGPTAMKYHLTPTDSGTSAVIHLRPISEGSAFYNMEIEV